MDENRWLPSHLKLFWKRYTEYALFPFELPRIRELREKHQQKTFFKEVPLAWFTGRRISIYLSIIFVRLGFHPDWVSFSMVPVSVIASLFFFLRFSGAIFIGYILLHLWFALDCSDGEVARMTNKCSSYGKDYDYLIHIICHPPIIAGITYYIFVSSGSELALWAGVFYLATNLAYRAKLPLKFYETQPKIIGAYYKNSIGNLLRKYFVTVPALILYLTLIEILRLINQNILLPSFIFFVLISSIVVARDLGYKLFVILRGDFK